MESGDSTTGQKAAFVHARREFEEKAAKERQADNARRNQPQSQNVETFPPSEDTGKTRDRLGERVGISGKSVDKFRKIRAERKCGEMLAEMPKLNGARDGKSGSHGVTPLSEIGVDKHQSSRWQRIARIPDHLTPAAAEWQDIAVKSSPGLNPGNKYECQTKTTNRERRLLGCASSWGNPWGGGSYPP